MAVNQVEEALSLCRKAFNLADESQRLEALPYLDQALDTIQAQVGEISPVTAVDLLERSCAAGDLVSVKRMYEIFPYFVYESFALVLAMRGGHEEVARWLVEEKRVDLLANIHRPQERVMLPHEGAFTRYGLTKTSTYLFLNPLDPTLSTYVFMPYSGLEQIEGAAYGAPYDIRAICDLVRSMAEDGLFDDTVFDDLFRASMMRAWFALRHSDMQDTHVAKACMDLGLKMMEMHRQLGYGDQRMVDLLGCLIVPRVSEDILYFIADNAPQVFLDQLEALDWMQQDSDMLSRMVGHLSPGTKKQNRLLLVAMAKEGYLDQVKAIQSWPEALDAEIYDQAIEAASENEQVEVATYLLTQKQRLYLDLRDGRSDSVSCHYDEMLDDLLL